MQGGVCVSLPPVPTGRSARAGVVSARGAANPCVSSAHGLEGHCHSSPVSPVQGCPHLGCTEHHCLVLQVCESTKRGAAPGCKPQEGVTPGCRVTASPNRSPMQGQPRRPGVPGKVMAQRKTRGSPWVQAPAQA